MKNATVLQILVAMMLLAVGVTAQAQQPKKVPQTIGFPQGGATCFVSGRIPPRAA